MRRTLLLLGLGILGMVAQSVAALHVRPGLVPDLGFLVVVTLGLHLPAVSGIATSAALGYAADLLSGALLGQHALLRMLACAATRLGNRRLDLRRPFPLAMFVAGLTVADGVGVAALIRLFAGQTVLDAPLLAVLGLQVVVNAAAAPLVWSVTSWLLGWVAPDEGARRTVRFEPHHALGATRRRA